MCILQNRFKGTAAVMNQNDNNNNREQKSVSIRLRRHPRLDADFYGILQFDDEH